MKISVIIPTLNEAGRIGPLLQQLHRIKTPQIVEWLVVDGGSTDATLKEAAPMAKVYQLAHQNRGAQLAYGASKSSGELLWFLHGDSQFDTQSDIYTEMVRILSDEKASAGYFKLAFSKKDWFYKYLATTSNWRAKAGVIFGDQGLFVRRSTYIQAGGFEGVPLMEDWLLSRKLHQRGHFKQLPVKLYTSSRKFEHHKLRTHLAMHYTQFLFLIGKSPETLARRYYKEQK